MKSIFSFLFLFAFIVQSSFLIAVENFKIGYVDMNIAINESEHGKSLSEKLRVKKQQLESFYKEMKDIEQELNQGGLLLNESSRLEKEERIKLLKTSLQHGQRDLRKEEFTMTKTLFDEIKQIVAEISNKKKFDFVLENQFSDKVILFSKTKKIDLTQEVIQAYNQKKNKAKKK